MKKRISKRGISPVISTVLLIALVFVLAVIIFIWARGFKSEQVEKFGSNIENSCSNINIDVDASKSGNQAIINLANNGAVPVYNVVIKIYKGFSKETIDFNKGEDSTLLDLGEAKTITQDIGDAGKIGVIPVLLGTMKDKAKTKEYVCYDSEITLEI